MKLFGTDAKPLFFVGLPTWGMHSYLFTQFLLGTTWPSNFSMHQVFLPGVEIGRSRNLLVHKAIEHKAKYLLFLDEDVIGPANGVPTLLFQLENHPEWTVCGGLYCTKSDPPEPLIYQGIGTGSYWGFKLGELVQITGFTGSGFHLFRVADLEQMKLPITYEDRDPWTGQSIQVREYFKTTHEHIVHPTGVATEGGTEDAFFYAMCHQEGLQVWVDTSIQCMHIDTTTGTVYTVPSLAGFCQKPDPWNAVPKVANLGAGYDANPYEVSVDLREGVTYKCDVRSLPADWTDQFDEVKSNHTLEHLSYKETVPTLTEWIRILKPGGKITIRVPDLKFAARKVVDDEMSGLVLGMMYGDQGSKLYRQPPYGGTAADGRFLPQSFENNSHKTGFTADILGGLFLALGLEKVFVSVEGYEVVAEGFKKLPPPEDKLEFIPLEETDIAKALMGGVNVTPQETQDRPSEEGADARRPRKKPRRKNNK